MKTKLVNIFLLIIACLLVAGLITSIICFYHIQGFDLGTAVNTITSLSIAFLTFITVFVTSQQMGLMHQQLLQMKSDEKSREEPFLDFEKPTFKIERPKLFHTPPTNEYSYQSRYFFIAKMKNISDYQALFVDIVGIVSIPTETSTKTLGSCCSRINVVAPNKTSSSFDLMFPTDDKMDFFDALRSPEPDHLPTLSLRIYYKSLSGKCYCISRRFYLDIPNEESAKAIANWHTSLSAAATENKEKINSLKRLTSSEEADKIYDSAAKEFDQKLLPGDSISLNLVEIPQVFALNEISEDDFENRESNHAYGQYIGFQTIECIHKEKEEKSKKRTRRH